MNQFEFLAALGLQKPLLAVRGDIFETPADHIAFAVHYPNKAGYSNNNNGGFSSLVAEYGWKDLGEIVFEKGKPVSKLVKGKYFHALPVHTNEEGGWDESPELIRLCFNRITVPSTEMIASVLMGGGNAGQKYQAKINNIEGMVRSYKSIALYIHDDKILDMLLSLGIAAEGIPTGTSLEHLPKVIKFRETRQIAAITL